jgi:hypothetical protein
VRGGVRGGVRGTAGGIGTERASEGETLAEAEMLAEAEKRVKARGVVGGCHGRRVLSRARGTNPRLAHLWGEGQVNPKLTCFSGTKVQILTLMRLPGDWDCLVCGNLVFKRKDICGKCATPRGIGDDQSSGGGKGDGDSCSARETKMDRDRDVEADCDRALHLRPRYVASRPRSPPLPPPPPPPPPPPSPHPSSFSGTQKYQTSKHALLVCFYVLYFYKVQILLLYWYKNNNY